LRHGSRWRVGELWDVGVIKFVPLRVELKKSVGVDRGRGSHSSASSIRGEHGGERVPVCMTWLACVCCITVHGEGRGGAKPRSMARVEEEQG